MKITRIESNPISFKYKSVLKSEWLKGNMPTVKYGIYGGELTSKNITLEHLQPKSLKGKTELANLALAVDVNNWQRGSKPLKDMFSKDNFIQYTEQFKDINLPEFNGLKYIESITKTIERLLKG